MNVVKKGIHLQWATVRSERKMQLMKDEKKKMSYKTGKMIIKLCLRRILGC